MMNTAMEQIKEKFKELTKLVDDLSDELYAEKGYPVMERIFMQNEDYTSDMNKEGYAYFRSIQKHIDFIEGLETKKQPGK